jgi:hypothetical protein
MSSKSVRSIEEDSAGNGSSLRAMPPVMFVIGEGRIMIKKKTIFETYSR